MIAPDGRRSPTVEKSSFRALVRPVSILLVAVTICAVLIWVAPLATTALLGLIGDPATLDAAFVDSAFTIALFAPLLVLALVGARLTGVRAMAPGRRTGAGLGIGLAIGVGGICLAAGYAWLAGTVSRGDGAGASLLPMIWSTVLVLLQAGSEEVYFRGWLQPVLARSWGGAAAALVSAGAFALLHIIGGTSDPLSIANLFLGGLLFGLLTLRAGGIAAAVAGHFAWNWAEQALFGLIPNPGVSSFGSIMDFELVGASIWGGSEEGLNASLAMTVVLAAFIAPLLIARHVKPAAITPAAESAQGRSGRVPA